MQATANEIKSNFILGFLGGDSNISKAIPCSIISSVITKRQFAWVGWLRKTVIEKNPRLRKDFDGWSRLGSPYISYRSYVTLQRAGNPLVSNRDLPNSRPKATGMAQVIVKRRGVRYPSCCLNCGTVKACINPLMVSMSRPSVSVIGMGCLSEDKEYRESRFAARILSCKF